MAIILKNIWADTGLHVSGLHIHHIVPCIEPCNSPQTRLSDRRCCSTDGNLDNTHRYMALCVKCLPTCMDINRHVHVPA